MAADQPVNEGATPVDATAGGAGATGSASSVLGRTGGSSTGVVVVVVVLVGLGVVVVVDPEPPTVTGP